MLNLAADMAWLFIVVTFWVGLAVVIAAGALAVWLEVTGR